MKKTLLYVIQFLYLSQLMLMIIREDIFIRTMCATLFSVQGTHLKRILDVKRRMICEKVPIK